MTGLAHIVTGIEDAEGLGLPPMEFDEFDDVLLDMEDLLFQFDPALFINKNTAQSRGGKPGLLTWNTAGWPLNQIHAEAAVAALNNKPGFIFTGPDHQFVTPIGFQSQNYTFVCVAALDAARYASTGDSSVLFNTFNSITDPAVPPTPYGSEAIFQAITSLSPKLMSHSPEANTSGNPLNVNLETLGPGPGEVAIWGVSFFWDGTVGHSEMYINNTQTPVGVRDIHPMPPRVDPHGRWTLGNLQFSHTFGWAGPMGRAWFFGGDYHTSTVKRDKLNALFAKARSVYNLPFTPVG